MLHISKHANCKFCPLSEKPLVPSILKPGCKLIVVGEAPGAEEESQGQPFVGASGRLLNWAFSRVKIFRPALSILNVISCRPPDNDIESLEGQEAINACRFRFSHEIDDLAKSGATTVLALGATAMRAFGIEGPIGKNRGSVYEYETLSHLKLNVIPTFHPSAIMRQHWKRSGGGSADNGVLWLSDFQKAKEISENGYSKLEERFILEPTVADVKVFVDRAKATNALVAIDIETTGLNRFYADIVVIGLATSSEDALSVPLLTSHGNRYWSYPDELVVRDLLNDLFSTCDLMLQNCFFDVPFLNAHNFTVPFERVRHDTLLIHHTISAELPHNLGSIVSVYGKTPYWKGEFINRKTSILEMDQKTMRTYNLRDCVVLHQIFPTMWGELVQKDLVDFYKTEVQPLIAPLLELSSTGIAFNPPRQEALKHRLEAEIQAHRQKLRELGGLPEPFNFESDEHIRWFLFGVEPSTFSKLAELPKKKPGTKVYRQLTELQRIRDEVRPIFSLKGWTPPKTETGKFSIDEESLLAYRIQLHNHLPKDEAEIVKLLEWLNVYSEYTSLAKIYSTYTKYRSESNGRIYGSWVPTGTVSGRLSCRAPNLMNLVKSRDDENSDLQSEIRRMFVAADGCKLISCDYVNLEAQLLAFETDDQELIEVFEKGLNLHDLNTKSMFHITPEDSRWKPARRAAKIFFFGGISYGGGDKTIFEKVCLEAPELHLTFAEFKQLKDNWMNDHEAYRRWRDRIAEQVQKTRTLRTEFGRMRQFLSNDASIVREALDFMIQSAGASLVNRAMIRTYQRIHAEGLRAKFVLQIHDQLVLEAPDDEVERAGSILKSEMERPFRYHGVERVIPAELAVGTSLADV